MSRSGEIQTQLDVAELTDKDKQAIAKVVERSTLTNEEKKEILLMLGVIEDEG